MEHSSVHVWGAHGDVSFLRSSPYCHFNSSAVQGAGLSLSFFLGLGRFAPTAAAAVDWMNCIFRSGERRGAFHHAVDAQPKWGTDPRFGTFLHCPPAWKKLRGLEEATPALMVSGRRHTAQTTGSTRMIKNSGEGNGQDGSCVRSDKADVLALAGGNFLSVVCTSQDCGRGRLWRNVVRSPLRLFFLNAQNPISPEFAMHVGQGVGCARRIVMFC